MTLPFTADEFFDVLAAYNQRLWPYALVLWLVTLCAVIAMIRVKPSRPWLMPAVLAVHWAWSGLAYHAAFFSTINPAAWLFAGLFLVEAGLLFWYGVVRRRLRLSGGLSVRGVLSWAFVGGSAAFLFGVHADLMLAAAGIVLAVDILASMHAKSPILQARNANP